MIVCRSTTINQSSTNLHDHPDALAGKILSGIILSYVTDAFEKEKVSQDQYHSIQFCCLSIGRTDTIIRLLHNIKFGTYESKFEYKDLDGSVTSIQQIFEKFSITRAKLAFDRLDSVIRIALHDVSPIPVDGLGTDGTALYNVCFSYISPKSLFTFKDHLPQLNELKETNPELFQTYIQEMLDIVSERERPKAETALVMITK